MVLNTHVICGGDCYSTAVYLTSLRLPKCFYFVCKIHVTKCQIVIANVLIRLEKTIITTVHEDIIYLKQNSQEE